MNIDIADLDNAIVDLQNTKQNLITSTNKIEGSNVKYNNSLSIIEKIDSLNTGGSQIPSISYNANLLETLISDTTKIGNNIKFSDDTVQSTGFTNSKNSDVVNSKQKLTDISYSNNQTTISNNLLCNNITGATIDDIYNDIGTKQDILNNTTSKLNFDCVDFTNSNIKYADFASSISSKFDSIDIINSGQVSTNSVLSGGISNLNTLKQNILSSENKLNPAFLEAGTGLLSSTKMQYLSSINGDIQNQLSLKANASDFSNVNNTSDINKEISTATQSALDAKQSTLSSINLLNSSFLNSNGVGMTNQKMGFLSSITSDIQTALNSKWETPSNANSLSFVDISSSLTTLLSNKWNTPSNASNLSNVDISSSLTTLLSNKWNTPSNASSLSFVDISSSLTNLLMNKWNTPYNELNLMNVDISTSLTSLLGTKANLNGNTYSGTHNFSGATVSGLTASSMIEDGSLTFAKTNGLQTALNLKQSINATYGLLQNTRNAGAVSATVVLSTTDFGKIVRFTTSAARQVNLPSLLNVPDGAWVAISCASTSSVSSISIFDSNGTSQILGSFNANLTTAGNCKWLMVLNGGWVAMAN